MQMCTAPYTESDSSRKSLSTTALDHTVLPVTEYIYSHMQLAALPD